MKKIKPIVIAFVVLLFIHTYVGGFKYVMQPLISEPFYTIVEIGSGVLFALLVFIGIEVFETMLLDLPVVQMFRRYKTNKQIEEDNAVEIADDGVL